MLPLLHLSLQGGSRCRVREIMALLIVCCQLSHVQCATPSPSTSNSKCTIYLAPSTIPRAGLGIFTTVPRRQGEIIGNGDVFLPLLEMNWHNEDPTVPKKANKMEVFFNPFSDYVWTGESMGMSEEVGSEDIEAMGPGLDAAINCNLALINVGKALPVWDDGGLHRSRDPGAGALTPYHNGTTPVLYRDIPAGGELFKHYGNTWFETRPQWFSHIPLTEDYPRAQHLLDAFGRLIGIGKLAPSSNQQPSYIVTRSYPNFTLPVNIQRDLWKLVSNLAIPSRTLHALPKNLEDAWVAIQDDLTALYQPYAIRSEEYLEQYGKCFDHIKPGRSTMPQAGRGAFAVRPLKKDTIITGTPLLHVPHYKVFNMYEFEQHPVTGQWQRRTNKVIGQQLKLNYCFGHAASTILLCPYGAGVPYINHNQTLANVRVRWSKHGLTSHNDEWLNMTPAEMEWKYQPNLALDYVALRDIDEGEELFLDYGNEFEAAWQFHVATWQPVENAASYSSAHDFNLRMANAPLRTDREQEIDPYPQHLQLRCHSLLSDPHWKQTFPTKSPAKDDVWKLDDKGHPCRVLHRFYDETTSAEYYDVMITDDGGHANPVPTQFTRTRVPRHAITFCDKPYTTDIHLRNAFRHPIMLPDDIFPQAWRNAIPRNVTTAIAAEIP